MDIDPDIASWVLDFLVRQPLEERTLVSLLRVLPLCNHQPTFIKLLLLKKLDLQLSTHSISEDTLDVLERLEELEFQEGRGANVSDSMRHAYCAVAVDCTVKALLAVNVEDKFDRFMDYCRAVYRVWLKRFERMEKALGKGGLISKEVSLWKEEIVAAVWNDKVYCKIVKMSEQINAVEAVGKYLREEREKMGSSFLEMLAVKVKDDEVLQQLLGVRNEDEVAEIQDTEIQNREMHYKKLFRSSRTAKIVDSDEVKLGLQGKKHVMEGSSGCGRRKRESHRNHVKKTSGKAIFVDSTSVDRAVNRVGVDHADVSSIPRPTLMKRNASVHTHECDRPVNESKEEVEGGLAGVDSPVRKRHESNKHKERRRPRRWSLLVEDALHWRFKSIEEEIGS